MASGFGPSADERVVLGQRRLAIIDLSPSGAQQMSDATGRWVISFNGEIYNHGAPPSATSRSSLDAYRAIPGLLARRPRLEAKVGALAISKSVVFAGHIDDARNFRTRVADWCTAQAMHVAA